MWVSAVATVILAGVIAVGRWGSVPGFLRYGAPAAGFVAFVLTAARSSRGVVCGEIAMLTGKWLSG